MPCINKKLMKLKLSLIFIIFCCLTCLGQKTSEKSEQAKIAAQQILIKKQILADQLDNQAKDVPFAAVRVFVRTKLAQWLWKDGKDDTKRAEQIAVRAVDELYEKKDELPESSFLEEELFALLELNAKETAKKLRAKYKVDSSEDLSNAVPLLVKEGGDKLVAAKIKKYLAENTDLGKTSFLTGMLRLQKSPEFPSILSTIVTLEETGGNSFPANSLVYAADDFRDAAVPNDLKIRFYKVVLSKGRNALQNGGNDITSADYLLKAVLPDINANAPELSAEANAIKAALSAGTSQRTKEIQERRERIAQSADKLAATIAEAEKADDPGDKYTLLTSASFLAQKEEKFQLAIDLIEQTIDNEKVEGFLTTEFRLNFHDQQLNLITDAALGKDDVESARYATKKIVNGLSKSESLRATADYFYTKKDLVSALAAYDEALKLAEKADNTDKSKFKELIRLVLVAQRIDKSRISEVTNITAKAIDRIPTLDADDKPGTENFKNYISLITTVNYNLYPIISRLAKENRNEAMDFASRINRKEVRIAADLALAVDEIDKESK